MLKFKKHDNDKEKSESKKDSTHRSRSRSRSRSPKRSSRSRYSRSPSPKRSSRSRYSRSPSPKRSYRRSPSPSRRHRHHSPSSSSNRRRSPRREDRDRRSRSPPKSKSNENKGVKRVLKQQPSYNLIQVEVNDRLGKKVRVKCAPNDLVGDFKKLVAAQIGTEPGKIVLKKWYKEYKDHITLADYEIHDGMNLELYYR